MGLKPGRDGGPPFKLKLDFLFQTRGGMGDVLAGLLDEAAVPMPKANGDGQAQPAADPKTFSPQAWRRPVRQWQVDGTWNADVYGSSPPDCPDCLAPDNILAEFGIARRPRP